jgi:hypothetical protein
MTQYLSDSIEHRSGRRAGVIPAEACYLGWQESFALLKRFS